MDLDDEELKATRKMHGLDDERRKIMCEYCDTDYKVLNKTKEYSDIEISLYTAIEAIRVRAIFDDTGLFKTQDVVKINFCPMCGKKLGE